MSRIFITGGNGNLGLQLSRIASNLDLDFTLLDRSWLTSPSGFANFASVNFSEGDLFLHFGWETKDKSRKSQLRCYAATKELAVTCRIHKVNLIFPSTHYACASSGSHYAKSKFLSEIAVQENCGIVLRFGLVVSPEISEIHPLISLLGKFPFFVSFRDDDGVVYVTDKQDFYQYFETQLKVWRTDPSLAFTVRPVEVRKTLLALQEELYHLRNQNPGRFQKRILIIDPRSVIRVSRLVNKMPFKILNRFTDPILNVMAGLQ